MLSPIISLKGVSAGYDGREVLSGVSLDVGERDFLGIIGPNGGGKTTLAKVMLGLLEPLRGEVLFFKDGERRERLQMGYLPQQNEQDRQFPISVRDVVLGGLLCERPRRVGYSRRDRERAMEMLEWMGMGDVAGQSFGQLSGGQRQRVLIARAMVAGPEVLILDEPTTYIDSRSTGRLYDLLEEVNERCAIVLVSHDVGTVLRNVRNIACVNRSVHYHAVDEVDEQELSEAFGCPFEMVAHGHVPHRVLGEHSHV